MLGSNPYMKGQLDPFSRLSTAHECERYTDRQMDNLVAKGPLRVLRTLHSSMRTINPTTTCERLRHICINPERFTVHPATAWWNLPSNSTRLGADRLYFTMGNPIPRRLAPSQGGGSWPPSDAMFYGPHESLCIMIIQPFWIDFSSHCGILANTRLIATEQHFYWQ